MLRDPPTQKRTPDGSTTPNNIATPPPMQPPLPPSVTASPPNGKLSESSPLLQAPPRSSNLSPSPFPENDDELDDEWTMPHRSSIYLIGLTLLMAGIQISWSVELAYISPYLLSLGLPKSTLSLVWMAGPCSGVIVQPLVGMMSDRCKFKWGRRRIFIVCSTVGVVVGFLGMGRTRSIVRWWTGRHDWESTRHAVIILAVASLIVLDLAINASMTLRLKIVDS
jgi:solute carrier family 45 protein 1/2/4